MPDPNYKDLRGAMRGLVLYAFTTVRERPKGEDCHHPVCCKLADHYDLWEEDRFPTWLSRVVEGVIRDVEEEESAA